MKKKFIYPLVLTKGKSARALKRNLEKAAMKIEIGLSPLGKMRPRQERKKISKALKVPFKPRYNGVILGLKHIPFEDERGYIKYKSELIEVE